MIDCMSILQDHPEIHHWEAHVVDVRIRKISIQWIVCLASQNTFRFGTIIEYKANQTS